MKKLSFLFAALVAGVSFGDVVVDDALPAGNIVFDRIEGNAVYVHQDLRDTTDAWFYWAMRVTGAAGKTLTFNFTTSDAVGVRGPVVTTDGGKTYSYPASSGATRRQFTYTFGADENETWFYEAIPYTPDDWAAFLAQHEAKRGTWFETGVLCPSSKKSAQVPKARFGSISGTPKYKLLLSSRHHCSETVATYVLEGIAAAFLKDDDLGAWLRANVLCEVVPFVDYDGAVAGDQGKSRSPHDHNRDYTEFIYTETTALAALATSLAPDAWFDIHCPWLYGNPNEYLYTPLKDPTLPYIQPANETRFSQILAANISTDGIPYSASNDIAYGTSWNTAANYSQGLSSIIWGLKNLSSVKLCRTFEVPFANAGGTTVTTARLRVLGGDIAKSLKAFLVELESAPASAEPEPPSKDLTKLPDDYTEIEYVQADHNQYIDTGYIPKVNTTIYFKFSVDDYNATHTDDKGTSTELKGRDNAYVLASYNDRCQFSYGLTCFMGFGGGNQSDNYNNKVAATKDFNIHELGITNSTFYLDGVSKYTGSKSAMDAKSQPLAVFALNASGTYKYWCGAKVYSLIISEDGVEKRHYIPAKDGEGNVGLYDTVNDRFDQSATGTSLIAGNPVGPVSDDPKFSGFSASSDLSRAWERVTVSDGASYGATVEAYMGTDTASWSPIATWTHESDSAVYAATNSAVSIGETYYCAFKMTYEKDQETIVKWTATTPVAISGTIHWSGKGADTKWTTAENWQEGVVPNAALTTHFSKDSLMYVTAGAEELSAKGVYVKQKTAVWDFQPETTLAMTYLHIGEKDKTTANLIVSNGVINSTGSIGFDNSNGSVWFAGTKATFAEKLYPSAVGKNTLKLSDGAKLKMPAYQVAGNATGDDTISVGEGSSIVLTGGSDYSTESQLAKNYTIVIDGGAWTNFNRCSFSTVAGGKSRMTVRNGGVFAHHASNHLSGNSKPLSLGGRGTTLVSITDGGLFEDLYELRFGDGADNYAGDSEIAITNGTLSCSGAITIGRDTRCQANYKVTVAGEDGLLDAKGGLTLGATAFQASKNRTAGSATLLVDGGTVKVTGALKIGAEYERVTDTLKVMGSTAKVTATSLVCTTNAVIKFAVPEDGFANDPVVATANNLALAADAPTPVEIDATACTSTAWQTLMQAGGEIKNLTLDQVSVSVARGKKGDLRLVKNDEEKVTALQFRIKNPGLMLLIK